MTCPGEGVVLRVLHGSRWFDAPGNSLGAAVSAWNIYRDFPCLATLRDEPAASELRRLLRPGRLYLSATLAGRLPAAAAPPVEGAPGLHVLADPAAPIPGTAEAELPGPAEAVPGPLPPHPVPERAELPSAESLDVPPRPRRRRVVRRRTTLRDRGAGEGASPPVPPTASPPAEPAHDLDRRPRPYDPARPLAAHLHAHAWLLKPAEAEVLALCMPPHGKAAAREDIASRLRVAEQQVQRLLTAALDRIDAATGFRPVLARRLADIADRAPVPAAEVAGAPWARGMPEPMLLMLLHEAAELHLIRVDGLGHVVAPFGKERLDAATDLLKAAAAAAAPDRHPLSLTKAVVPALDRLLARGGQSLSRAERLALARVLTRAYAGCDAIGIQIGLGLEGEAVSGLRACGAMASPEALAARLARAMPEPPEGEALRALIARHPDPAPAPPRRGGLARACLHALEEARYGISEAALAEAVAARTGRPPPARLLRLVLSRHARPLPGPESLWVTARDPVRPEPRDAPGDLPAVPERPASRSRKPEPADPAPARIPGAPRGDWPEERTVRLAALWLAGESISEIARLLGVGEGAVRTRVKRVNAQPLPPTGTGGTPPA